MNWSNSMLRRSLNSLNMTLVLGTLLLGLTLGCGEAELEPIPDEILGVWLTDAPSYQGRTFEIRKDMIQFGTGEYSAPAIHSVIGVERMESSDGSEIFAIHHRESDGTSSQTKVAYRPGNKPSMTAATQPTLVFVNRKEVWKRMGRANPDA